MRSGFADSNRPVFGHFLTALPSSNVRSWDIGPAGVPTRRGGSHRLIHVRSLIPGGLVTFFPFGMDIALFGFARRARMPIDY